MKVSRTPVATAVSLSLMSLAMAASAQQATPDTKKEGDKAQLETVTVKGIRASLRTAVNTKKQANAVVDALSAEDIGKLPDSDVGQSLGRIPGISVGLDFGVGASVSIRGTDPQMTYTTLNGQTMASTGWYDQKAIDRSFNYSLLPPELIGGIEVYKSSQADLTEGGIGGTVIVKTRKPLDLASGTGFASVKLGKGTVSNDLDKEASALYSFKNDAKTFGVLAAVTAQRGNYIRRGIEADGRWSGDVVPGTFIQDRQRTGVNLTLQAKPDSSIDLGLNYTRLEYDANASNTTHYAFTLQDPGKGYANTNACVTPAYDAALLCKRTEILAANATSTFMQTWAREAKMTSDGLTVDGIYRGNGFRLSGVAGTTKADGGTSLTSNYSYLGWGNAPGLPKWSGVTDASGSKVVMYPTTNMNVSLANLPGTSGPESWAVESGPNHDKETYAQGDLSADVNWGMFNTLKAGARATDHTFGKTKLRPTFAATAVTAPTASLFNGTMPIGTGGWNVPKPNLDAMFALTRANVTGWVQDRSGFGELNEKNHSIYGMAEFEQDQLRGNVGLRYVHTKASAQAYLFDGVTNIAGDIAQNKFFSKNLTTREASYSDVLPSLNLAYTVDKENIVRFAASKAITRPNYDNMFIGGNVQGFNDTLPNNETVTYGNVGLKPMSSKQFDLSWEHYYDNGSLFALTYFHKNVDNFITSKTLTGQSIGLVSPDTGKDLWTVNQIVNGGGGKINGIEAQLNHNFGNGYGVVANYTFTDAKAPGTSYADGLDLFTMSSKHNVNLVGYYETSAYSARLAYSWRSKYMVRETGYYSNRMHDAYGSLDLSLGWNFDKNIRVSFDAVNLLKADDVQYGAANLDAPLRASLKGGYPVWAFKGETTFRVGVSAKF